MRSEFTTLICEIPVHSLTLKTLRIAAAVLMIALFSFARFAPTYALSGISLVPTNIPTNGIVTITITQVVGPGPDVFSALTVTDPLGNVFAYSGTPFGVTSGFPVSITFPDPGSWTMTSGPGGNVGGTDVPGMYMVHGTYLDTGLTVLTGHFIVLHNNGTFQVPEFGQSILLLLGVMLPALLLVRKMSSKQPI